MNLKIELPGVKIELQNSDLARVEKTLLAAFAHVEGGSFVDTYNQSEVKERPVNSKRNHIEAIDGVRTHANGTKEYKCSYSCTCGNKGTRYVHEDAINTSCHKCKSELTVVPAVENDAHDMEFNYFIAY